MHCIFAELNGRTFTSLFKNGCPYKKPFRFFKKLFTRTKTEVLLLLLLLLLSALYHYRYLDLTYFVYQVSFISTFFMSRCIVIIVIIIVVPSIVTLTLVIFIIILRKLMGKP